MVTTTATTRMQRAKRILADLTELDVEALPYAELRRQLLLIQERAHSAIREFSQRGNPELSDARTAATESRRAQADRQLEALRPFIAKLAQEGLTTAGEVLPHLIRSEFAPPRGGEWKRHHVTYLLKRLEETSTPNE